MQSSGSWDTPNSWVLMKRGSVTGVPSAFINVFPPFVSFDLPRKTEQTPKVSGIHLSPAPLNYERSDRSPSLRNQNGLVSGTKGKGYSVQELLPSPPPREYLKQLHFSVPPKRSALWNSELSPRRSKTSSWFDERRPSRLPAGQWRWQTRRSL